MQHHDHARGLSEHRARGASSSSGAVLVHTGRSGGMLGSRSVSWRSSSRRTRVSYSADETATSNAKVEGLLINRLPFVAESDASAREVVRRDLDCHTVAIEDANSESPHFSRERRNHRVPVIQATRNIALGKHRKRSHRAPTLLLSTCRPSTRVGATARWRLTRPTGTAHGAAPRPP